MQQLIPLHTQHIDGDATQTVNARELHTFLEAGKDFSTWIRDRIQQYGFLENQDYIVFANFGENPKGGRPAKEYAITLDMAKEMSMVERNEKGREARRYFIACEKALREQQRQPLDMAPSMPASVSHRADHAAAAARYFGSMMRAAGIIKMSQRRAAVAANQATMQDIGMDILATLGVLPEELEDTLDIPQTQPQEEDTLGQQLQRWLAEPAQLKRLQLRSEDIMAGLYGPIPPSNSRALATRIGQAMARLGWPKRRLPPDSQGHRAWVYCRPA